MEPQSQPVQAKNAQLPLLPGGKEGRARKKEEKNRSGIVLIEDLKREVGYALPLLRRIEARHKGDPLRQINELFAKISIPAATGRKREASIKTYKAYVARLRKSVQDLSRVNMRIQNLTELSRRHAVKLVQLWEGEKASPAYMQNLVTPLRRLGVWIGKTDMVPRLVTMTVREGSARRSLSARSANTLSAKGIDPELLFQEMSRHCVVAGLQLRIMVAFGLRVEEMIMFRPEKADRGKELLVTFGTKGGRARTVPIETPQQRDLLEQAKVIAAGNARGILTADPSLSYDKARNHFYYLVRLIGMTKKGLAVTPHSLRHTFANDTYERLAGAPSPVHGGKGVDIQVHRDAQQEVAERCGHGRRNATSAYTGSPQMMERGRRERMEQMLEEFKTNEAVRAALTRSGIARLLIVGPPADGEQLHGIICAAWEATPGTHGPDLANIATVEAAIGAAFEVQCFLLPLTGMSGKSTLEVF
jgi:integrase